MAAPAWDTYPPDRGEPGLEAYPRIVKELTLTWGTHECRRLLDRLLYDNRQGGRRGFTLNAYNDLVALRRAADAVIHRIDEDLAEESKVRSAYASAAAEDDAGAAAGRARAAARRWCTTSRASATPICAMGGGSQSALEREHPALAAALARDWSNAALVGRLSEMLARVDEATPPLSKEAAEDVDAAARDGGASSRRSHGSTARSGLTGAPSGLHVAPVPRQGRCPSRARLTDRTCHRSGTAPARSSAACPGELAPFVGGGHRAQRPPRRVGRAPATAT